MRGASLQRSSFRIKRVHRVIDSRTVLVLLLFVAGRSKSTRTQENKKAEQKEREDWGQRYVCFGEQKEAMLREQRSGRSLLIIFSVLF